MSNGEATDQNGLTREEAAARLSRDGPNELPTKQSRSIQAIVREVLSEPMFLLLLAAGGIYLVLGDLAEAAVLLVFANLSVGIAIVQEIRSERVLDALRDLSAPTAVVIRSGQQQNVPARELVAGDLVLVAEGDRVPADARLVAGEPLQVDESLLTGESVPVRKRNARAEDTGEPVPGGDDQPWIYSGTLVARGQGRGIVFATGASSQIGRIGHALESITAEPPRLHAQTRRLVRIFGSLGVTLSALVIGLYYWLHGAFIDALLAGIAVGMSLLPEEFPLVLTVFMVMGAWRISRAGVLTRRAAAIESLGAATVLCTDKTGTLTHNRMVVAALAAPAAGSDWSRWKQDENASPEVLAVLEGALLGSSADALDPMDRAVHESADALLGGAGAWLAKHPRTAEFGLTPELPAMASVARSESGETTAAAKGAPEAIAVLCRMEDSARQSMLGEVDRLAREGIRVLAVARATPAGDAPESPADIPFSFTGLIGFADPVREGVAAAVRECQQAGVRVVMITGDYPGTAAAIARDAGIAEGQILVGPDLASMPPEELVRRVRDCTVFARVQPEQKLTIVEALKAGGDIVAMTGDGVNDAPALRAAHIGVAMGRRGTDVAREASSIVLLEDDFQAIVKTIRLGRRIYDNLRKAMGYVVALHLPIAGLAVLPLVFGLPLILTPMMIAFLEMIIDPVCSVVFEAEPEESEIMSRPPRDPQSAILPMRLIAWCAAQGTVAFAAVGGAFLLAWHAGQGEEEMRSVVFASLVATNIALLFTNRSFRSSWLESFSRPNSLVWWTIAAALGMLAIVLGWSPARELFRLGALDGRELGACALAGVSTFVVVQLGKRFWQPRLAA
jgi:Ca2+-transporting ATPase